MILLHHHLGLGDHIVCNGMVREIRNRNGPIILACKSHNILSVSRMYKDTDIGFIVAPNDYSIEAKYGEFSKVIRVGFEKINVRSSVSTEEQFYNLAGIPFEYKYFGKFPYNEPKGLDGDYIFIHDDADRGMKINLKTEFNIVRPDKKDNLAITDYIPIIKNAKEVHVIESSFMHLIECHKEELNKNIVVHKVRNYEPAEKPVLKKNWIYV